MAATDTMIDFVRLREKIIEATVRAVNATLYIGEERALKDVPVRKVFKGGRQTVRFKTAAEIEADKDLRSRLGLAPEILATPALIAKVKAAGLNPKKGRLRRERLEGLVNLDTGGPVGRDVEYGFARTISFPARGSRTSRGQNPFGINQPGYVPPGLTRAQRGLLENRRDRANDFIPGGVDRRRTEGGPTDEDPSAEYRLVNEKDEARLSSRGRWELQSGRAVRDKTEIRVDRLTGRMTLVQTEYQRLGGGLKSTIRIVKASPATYPVIEGWLIAGDSEHRYAIYQELGTRHNAAHPFLRPRLPEWKEELPVQLRRSLGRASR